MWLWLAAAAIAGYLLLRGLRWFAGAPPERIRIMAGWLGLVLGAVLLLVLLRLGQTPLASGLGLVLMVAPFFLRRGQSGTKSVARPMSAEEAARILEVDIAADPKTIRAAHRRLMQHNHPDQGGSAEIARMLNEARDVLLKRPR